MTPEEALAAEERVYNGKAGPTELSVIVYTLAAEVRACHATIARMIVEREELDRELAKWRKQ